MDARRTTLAAAGERKAGTGGLAPPQHHSGCLPKGKQCHETHLRNAGGGVRIGPGRLHGSRDTLAHRKPNRHIDGDGGAHFGADGDSDRDADRDGDADGGADFGADGDSDRAPHGFADSNANTYAQRDPRANTDSNANTFADRDPHGNTDPHADRDPHGNTDPHANRDPDCNTNPNANPNHGHPRQPAPDCVGWRSRLLEEVPES